MQRVALSGAASAVEAKFTLPTHLEGRWSVHVVVRAEPAGDEPSAIALGVYARNLPSGNANEARRVIA